MYKDIDPIVIMKGRYINQRDLDERRKVAVIGKRVRQLLFEKEEKVLGSHIQVQGVTFTVVGVYRSQQTGEDAEEAENAIFTPYTTFNHAFNMGDRVGWMSLLIKEEIQGDTAMAEVLRLLKAQRASTQRPTCLWALEHGGITRRDDHGVQCFSVGVLRVWWACVVCWSHWHHEHHADHHQGTHEGTWGEARFGRNASQHRHPNHGGTLTLTILAGLVGGVLGVFVLDAIDAYLVSAEDNGIFRHPHVTLDVLLTALGTMTILGAFAGILPALRALRIQPVEALRT